MVGIVSTEGRNVYCNDTRGAFVCVYGRAAQSRTIEPCVYSFVRRLSGEVDGIDIAVINRHNDFI